MRGCPHLQSEDYLIMNKATFAYLGASILCAALTASAQANPTLQNKQGSSFQSASGLRMALTKFSRPAFRVPF